MDFLSFVEEEASWIENFMDRDVYLFLASKADKEGIFQVSKRRISEKLGISILEAKNSRRRLEKAGLIRRLPKKSRNPYAPPRYQICVDSEVPQEEKFSVGVLYDERVLWR